MIEWLNCNQGFTMGLLTMVYVAATICMAMLMLRSNTLSSESLRLAVELDENRSRPYLVFDIQSRDRMIYAVLKNIGLTPAYGAEVEISPQLSRLVAGKQMPSSLIGNKVHLIEPNREMKDVITGAPDFFVAYPNPVFSGTVCYRDSLGNTYSESFEIDLDFQKNVLTASQRTELERIREVLEQISESLAKLTVREQGETDQPG